jgi:hypothetical protein
MSKVKGADSAEKVTENDHLVECMSTLPGLLMAYFLSYFVFKARHRYGPLTNKSHVSLSFMSLTEDRDDHSMS